MGKGMKKVSVTTSWDDGHVLDVRLAALLKKYGIKGTFYISPNDREFSQDKLLTRNQVKAIAEDFEIGAHTMTHPQLPLVSDEEARKEIVDSKKYLEEVTGKPVTSFCYPRGAYKPKHVAMVKEAGVTLARTVELFHASYTNPLAMPTTRHAYLHWSVAWPIFKKVGFKKFLSCYLNWDKLAIELFNQTPNGEVFHLWGHSWEVDNNKDWERLEKTLAAISKRAEVVYVTNRALYE